MINVKQLLYRQDNFAYILYNEFNAVVIDPGCPKKIMEFTKENNLKISAVLNTHTHADHTMGNSEMEKLCGVKVTDMEYLIKKGSIYLDGSKVDVLFTPGHTMDCVCFYCDGKLITGDTLFIANVGNCFTGEYKTFYNSLNKIFELPDETMIYPGHDYTERSVKRVLKIEPKNIDAVKFWENYNPPPVCSTIKNEKKINPYIRAHTEELKNHLNQKGKDTGSDFKCFKSFLEVY